MSEKYGDKELLASQSEMYAKIRKAAVDTHISNITLILLAVLKYITYRFDRLEQKLLEKI